ncbi:hypothetical protein MAR_018082 [Mya arenaria]|uniref:Uncharacterized protein n=1 Tax=Mya arenaria TaxID=6604 RepID=A0ABY7EGB3_MYAAR|nr:hypothetical protein MAR_018082 [Mya arenaria]
MELVHVRVATTVTKQQTPVPSVL